VRTKKSGKRDRRGKKPLGRPEKGDTQKKGRKNGPGDLGKKKPFLVWLEKRSQKIAEERRRRKKSNSFTREALKGKKKSTNVVQRSHGETIKRRGLGKDSGPGCPQWEKLSIGRGGKSLKRRCKKTKRGEAKSPGFKRDGSSGDPKNIG